MDFKKYKILEDKYNEIKKEIEISKKSKNKMKKSNYSRKK